jgi:hypothetical protein
MYVGMDRSTHHKQLIKDGRAGARAVLILEPGGPQCQVPMWKTRDIKNHKFHMMEYVELHRALFMDIPRLHYLCGKHAREISI